MSRSFSGRGCASVTAAEGIFSEFCTVADTVWIVAGVVVGGNGCGLLRVKVVDAADSVGETLNGLLRILLKLLLLLLEIFTDGVLLGRELSTVRTPLLVILLILLLLLMLLLLLLLLRMMLPCKCLGFGDN